MPFTQFHIVVEEQPNNKKRRGREDGDKPNEYHVANGNSKQPLVPITLPYKVHPPWVDTSVDLANLPLGHEVSATPLTYLKKYSYNTFIISWFSLTSGYLFLKRSVT